MKGEGSRRENGRSAHTVHAISCVGHTWLLVLILCDGLMLPYIMQNSPAVFRWQGWEGTPLPSLPPSYTKHWVPTRVYKLRLLHAPIPRLPTTSPNPIILRCLSPPYYHFPLIPLQSLLRLTRQAQLWGPAKWTAFLFCCSKDTKQTGGSIEARSWQGWQRRTVMAFEPLNERFSLIKAWGGVRKQEYKLLL